MIVLDTHVLIWFVQGNERLGLEARRMVQQTASQGEAMVSTITLWEIAMLARRRRLPLRQPVQDWLDDLCARSRLVIVEVSKDIAIAAGMLADDIHGDPADRIIMATARQQDCPLLTADRAILAYGSSGHVQALDARL